ncbi:MAG: MerR family transcriptional regulator [Aestuariivirga sp.]|uniref:MerR family transcriptional regulator n=1 Tax=Aestuariivirga sp. TaxID=2650926 RepID=UPI0025B8EFEC|nr:MerR family transcriptional regulator [Aestuariivirga sp.]MCA3561297.1 MerR family transcriptional regulator [Aestuariivirga sp.]
MVEKSPDAFRTISEAAEELDVPQHVLRFWETRFTQIKPMKRAGGRRYYRPADVELLQGIRSLLYKEGYTIRGVQKILKEDGAVYVAGVGRGEVEPRKREGEMASAPPPGMSKPAPRVKDGKPVTAPAEPPAQPLLPLGEVRVVVNRLSESHADMLRAALRDLGDARRILDPSQSR